MMCCACEKPILPAESCTTINEAHYHGQCFERQALLRCPMCRRPILAIAPKKTVEGAAYHAGCWDRKVRAEKAK